MAIKMRNNKKSDAFCCECGDGQHRVLNMFDICIGGKVLTICDACNEKLLYKSLSAEVMKNGRVKSQEDLAIIRRRSGRMKLQNPGGE